MKNFTKKLALLLVFAMVLGVVAPGNVAKADGESKKVYLDFKNLTLQVKAGSTYYADYEFAQLVQDATPTTEKIEAIKDKDWVLVDGEDRAGSSAATKGDISWFNKKKASYAVVRFYEGGKYTYIWSDKIEAQTDAFKVLFTTTQEGEKTKNAPAYTSAQAIGTPKTGYLVFYTGKGDTAKVVTPSVLSFRVDGSYNYKDVYGSTNTFTSGVKRGSYDIIDVLERGIAKGITLQFVQMKEDGSSTSHTDAKGWPTNKEVKFKLSAQKAAPTVKVDINHTVALKAGQEYRVVNAADGSQKGPWVDVEKAHGVPNGNKVKVGKILLEDLVVSGGALDASRWVDADGTLNAARLADGEVKLQVRTAATAKAVASKVYSVTVSQQAISSTSAASINGAKGVDVSIGYTVPHDPSKGLTIKNNLPKDGDTYEFTFTTSGASVTGDNKWTAVKADKSAAVKTLADSKTKEEYTKIWVRKVGDKKANLLSSNMVSFDLEDVPVTKQTITEIANGTVDGVSGSAVKVTSDGAVSITIPKAAVSDAAIEGKTVEVTVANVTKAAGQLSWKTQGNNPKITLDKPSYATNKVTFKLKKVDKGATGDTTYVLELENLKFTVKVTIGN